MMPSNPDVRDNHGLLDACYKGFLRSVKQSLRDFSEYYLDLNQLMISANVEHMVTLWY